MYEKKLSSTRTPTSSSSGGRRTLPRGISSRRSVLKAGSGGAGESSAPDRTTLLARQSIVAGFKNPASSPAVRMQRRAGRKKPELKRRSKLRRRGQASEPTNATPGIG